MRRDTGGVPSRLTVAACGAALALALTGCGESSSSGSPVAPQLKVLDTGTDGTIAAADRQPAPVLTGTTLDGKALSTADYAGQVVVLNFWASWCGPCRSEVKTLNEAAAQTRAEGVQFIGVNVKDDADAARAFERAQQVPYPSLSDQPGRLLLGFRGIVPQTPPTTLVLDRQGRIAASFTGEVDLLQLRGPLEQIAAESA